MITDLRQQIASCGRKRVCLMGLGGGASGDDAFGVRLAEDLALSGLTNVIVAGTEPERFFGRVVEAGYDHLVFLDSVDVGAAPGSAVWLDSRAMTARFPQMSTHRISLGMLARLAESYGGIRVWLLGVQPQSLKPADGLTPPVEATCAILRGWLLESCPPRTA